MRGSACVVRFVSVPAGTNLCSYWFGLGTAAVVSFELYLQLALTNPPPPSDWTLRRIQRLLQLAVRLAYQVSLYQVTLQRRRRSHWRLAIHLLFSDIGLAVIVTGYRTINSISGFPDIDWHPYIKPCSTNPLRFSSGTVGSGVPEGNRLTEVHLLKRPELVVKVQFGCVGNWRGLQENTARSGQSWTRSWRDEMYSFVLYVTTKSAAEDLWTCTGKAAKWRHWPESGCLYKHCRNIAYYWWSGVCHRPRIC